MKKEVISQSTPSKPQNSMDSYHTHERYEKLINFVQSAFPNHTIKIDSLPGDASFRRYHRVELNCNKCEISSDNLDPTYIVMDAPPQLESIESFVRINKLMADNVNVPSLLAQSIKDGFLILQDFGSVEFAHLVADAKIKQDFGKIDELYHWAMDCLLALQKINVENAQQQFEVPLYNRELLQREINLFSEWFLPYIGVNLDDQISSEWLKFTDSLINNIEEQPVVVVHRDYHSRNLMQDQYNKNDLGVIDFQDAVIGSYAYDLVSLVRDAYVEWDDTQIDNWIKYYWQHSKQLELDFGKSLEELSTDLNLIGLQRHLKILGIFIRLSERDGKSRYLSDIPKVWRDLIYEMKWLDEHANHEIKSFINPIYQWITTTVKPKFDQKFNNL